jgi:hypothetical protein
MIYGPRKAFARVTSEKKEHCKHHKSGKGHQSVNKWRRGLRLGALACAIIGTYPLSAQSITGGLHGLVPASASGATVEVTRADTGYARTLAVKDGRYILDNLSPGLYTVQVKQDGQVLGQYAVKVTPNTSANVPTPSAAGGNAKTLNAVTVTSKYLDTVINPIDVSTPELSTTYSSKLIRDLPVNPLDVNAVGLLQSDVRNASGYLQVAGNSPSENRWYYNEFDTTYDVNGSSGFSFPQNAVDSTQFIAGNGSLMWTSTTGSVTSATLRQGSNNFHFGYDLYYWPGTSTLLNSRVRDLYDSNGNYVFYGHADSTQARSQQYAWLSGALVKDKLFFFVMLGTQPPSSYSTYSPTYVTDTSTRNKDALLNLTWNITKNQALDLAAYKTWWTDSYNTYQLSQPFTPASASSVPRWSGQNIPSKLAVANYQWQITEDMSFHAMAGTMRQDNAGTDLLSGEPYVSESNMATGVFSQLYGGVSDEYTPVSYYYSKRGLKGDFNWTLGDHQITIGGEKYENGYHWEPATNPNGVWQYYVDCGCTTLPNGAAAPANGNYVDRYTWEQGGTYNSNQEGYYAFDSWQAMQNLVIQGGARLDLMHNNAAQNEPFLSLRTLSPRIGAAWDVRGDSSWKVGFNAGKYTLPMPSTLSYTMASPTTSTTTYYSYGGLTPGTSIPTGLQQLGAPVIGGTGVVPNTDNIVSRNIQNTYQYEFQLYTQYQLGSNWSFLAQMDDHILKNAIDDICDSAINNPPNGWLSDGPISQYVRANGYPNYPGLANGCMEFNPGRSLVLLDNLSGNDAMRYITIPSSYLGIPAAKRQYYALTLKLSHARSEDEPYVLTASYTWSHLYGNFDGYNNLTHAFTGSNVSIYDNGSNPVYNSIWPGQTGDFAFTQMTAGSSGDLVGDIPLAFNLSGVYYWSNGLHLGALLSGQSGSPYSCLGTYPVQNPNLSGVVSWGTWTHYCNGQLNTEGTAWRAPFAWFMNLNLGYDITIRGNKLSFNFIVNNVFNKQAVINRNMAVDTGNFGANGLPVPNAMYLAPTAVQAPRSTELVMHYSF